MPRLTAILATQAPVALVIRGGPNRWHHILRWHLDTGVLEPGAWVRKNLYLHYCDLSPDGLVWSYYMNGYFDGGWEVWRGIARAPWLSPTQAEQLEGTGRGGGWSFIEQGQPPGQGKPGPITVDGTNYFVRETGYDYYCPNYLRRRGWVKATDSPGISVEDTGSERFERARFIYQKSQRTNDIHIMDPLTLRLIFKLTGFGSRYPVCELQQPNGETLPLEQVTTAAWDHRGHLLTGTADGMLRRQIVSMAEDTIRFETVEQHDLSNLTPDPQPPPEWASLET